MKTNTLTVGKDLYRLVGFSVLSVADETLFLRLVLPVMRSENPPVRGWLQLCEFHLLCEFCVEHPRRKKSGENPVLQTLWNDCVACLRFLGGECHVDGFAQTLRG